MNERHRYTIELGYDKTRCATPEALKGVMIVDLNQITDCAVLFGARYGFTQATELGVLLALLLAISMFVSVIILFAYYRRERRQKISYIDAHRSHSRTALTLSQHLSRSPSSVIEPLTSSPDDSISASISAKIPPPPPPPNLTNY
ncbi:unnamed protein product [Enterobius vermicularis]|uniref:Uncharacterized protein n=1 Tax=Enterobius vermicularis TaxID=51028 RepID=A0A0N4V2L4_ENTVE|nr:unnamed protein product [Enterobius vermicularis]